MDDDQDDPNHSMFFLIGRLGFTAKASLHILTSLFYPQQSPQSATSRQFCRLGEAKMWGPPTNGSNIKYHLIKASVLYGLVDLGVKTQFIPLPALELHMAIASNGNGPHTSTYFCCQGSFTCLIFYKFHENIIL